MRNRSKTGGFDDAAIAAAYWHAPYRLPDGRFIPATRQGNDKRVPARANMLRALIRCACGSLAGRTVLDLGCADGYFSRVALSMDAESVLGLDVNPAEIEKARWLKKELQEEKLRFEVADVTNDEMPQADVILCLGLLYHLENPLHLMKRLAVATRGLLIVDTDVLPLTGPLARLEVEDSRSWKAEEGTLVCVPTPTTLTMMAYTAGFSRETYLNPGNTAPVDYRSGRRRMTAFHKGPHPGRIPSCYRRPADDGVSKPFTGRYWAGAVAYRLMNATFRLLDPLTHRW